MSEVFIGQRSEEDPPHKITAAELLELLQHPDCDGSKPIDVQVPMGWAAVSSACISYTGTIHLHLAEEWR